MYVTSALPRHRNLPQPIPGSQKVDESARDNSGYPLFCDGDAGAIHVMAHRMLDDNRIERGRQLLGAWLDGRTGSGSRWVHLQWHMAVFDLSSGHWHAALARFRKQILPAVNESSDALTDAPALLWRLSLASDKAVALPWGPVRARALEAMHRPSTSFVKIHNLLALAGAGDLCNLEKWIRQQTACPQSGVESVVVRIATALRSYITGNYRAAAATFEYAISHISEFGGSRAQNDLFSDLQRSAHLRSITGDSPIPQLIAA